MRNALLKSSMAAMLALAAILLMSCSEEEDRSTKHQLTPKPAAAPKAAPSESASTTTTTTSAPTPVEKKEKVELDPRVPTLVYSEMDTNERLGWDKVDGPISDYKHATWPGECAAEGIPQCKETYYGQWCQDSCSNLWGVVELASGDICARKTDVKLCAEW